jgi:uncharacterized protein YaaQ
MPENKNPAEEPVDQLIFVVVADEQAGDLGKKLVAEGFRFTIISVSTGLLPVGTSCLMLGTHSDRNAALMKLVESVCKTRRRYISAINQFGVTEGQFMPMIEAQVGSADVFILPVESYEYF